MDTDTAKRMSETACVLARECDLAPAKATHLADTLRRLSQEHCRLQEAQCNGPLTKRQETRERNIEATVRKLIADHLPGVTARFQGDPRGYTVRLLLPSGAYNSWDGKTWGI